MLIKCPECELQVSDKAYACPHCGYPLKGKSQNSHPGKKRMRLPNSFGQISKITSKKMRNPYRAMVTVGKNANGKPIVKLLKPNAYFATYNEAYEALIEYNRNPYDLASDMTVHDLYDRWSEQYFKTLKNPSSIRTIQAAWKFCYPVYNMDVRAIRARHIKGCIEETNASPNIQSRIKSVFNLMLDYALEYELVERNYARDFKLSDNLTEAIESNKKQHEAFSDEEISLLWQHRDSRIARMIIVQTFMGWRPQELLTLEKKNIVDGFITGGSKTEAGIDRPVPIHSCIRDLIKPEGDLLFEDMTYNKYKYYFDKCMKELGIEGHRPHDPRKTFVTLAKKYGVDEYAIKRIVGHAISDITEKVYTDRSLTWLSEEIEKIKGPVD